MVMSQSMVQFQLLRRLEIQRFPRTVATGSPTKGIGSLGNTEHLNLTEPMPWAYSPRRK